VTLTVTLGDSCRSRQVYRLRNVPGWSGPFACRASWRLAEEHLSWGSYRPVDGRGL